MTTRIQALRSSTTQAVPAAGTRLPGELWTNFPDLQMGVIDASKNAQKLIAVRYFSTAANYAANDMVVQSGAIYLANGAVTAGAFTPGQWTKIASVSDLTSFGANYLPLGGGTLTGALLLAADPGAALGAATKQYVDGKVSAAPFLPLAGGTLTGLVTLSGPPTVPLHAATKAYVDSGAFVPVTGGANTGLNDNRVINGDMGRDQRNNGASIGVPGYPVDRWSYNTTQANKGSVGRNVLGQSGPSGFPYCLGFQAAGVALAAGDTFYFAQSIEADMVSDFAWGTANAQPVTLSFWAYSSQTGTFSGTIRNWTGSTSNRSYPFTFSISTASTWTKVVVTIPGDTGGAWAMSGNGAALYLCFDLGSGATYRGLASTWAAGAYSGATGSVSVAATSGTTFYVTGVKLEIGSVATPFNRQSLAKSMADCQRYYQTISGIQWGGYSVSPNLFYTTVPLKVTMCAAPTIVLSGQSYGSAASATVGAITADAVALSATANATGTSWARTNFTASAEL